MKKILVLIILLFLFYSINAQNRIKDITNIKGISSKPVVGYGIVAGLNNTGDCQRSIFTNQSLKNMLDKFGIKLDDNQARSRNVAGVMVTAEVPPFTQLNSRFDVTVSSIGDSKSLEGGTLLPTDLYDLEGNKFAIAQGPISVGGYSIEVQNVRVGKNHLLVGNIPDGGILLNNFQSNIGEDKVVLALKSPDINTAVSIAEAIDEITDNAASIVNAGAVELIFPDSIFFSTRIVEGKSSFVILNPSLTINKKNEFLSEIVNLTITPETIAKVVINEKTGTIVIGEYVTISPVAISYHNINIKISSIQEVSQPAPFSMGQTVTTSQSAIEVSNEYANLKEIKNVTTVEDIVTALNQLGATPRDLIGIFQTLKRAGALHAELILM